MTDQPGRVRPVGDDDFADVVLGAAGLVAVEFRAGWSLPCRRSAPLLDTLAAELSWLRFACVDVDRGPGVAAAYGVTALPTLLVFAGGEQVLAVGGGRSRDVLRDLLLVLRD